jgi:hypothetical protein
MKSVAWLLRVFAFAWIGVLGLHQYHAPELRDTMGPDSWRASLLTKGPARLVVRIGVTSLNAGAAMLHAASLDS